MDIDTKSTHITPIGGNVFADLGFDQDEALQLQSESRRIVAKKLALKEQLMTEISDWIISCQLRQTDAAVILGVSRPRVSDVIQKKTTKFTIDSLVDMLSRTGKNIEFSSR